MSNSRSSRRSSAHGFYPDYAEDFVDRGREFKKGDLAILKSWFDASNAKAAKGIALKMLNTIHYMAPATQAREGAPNPDAIGNVCPWAARCVKPCLTSSGKGGADSVIAGRIRRSRLWWEIGPEKYCDLHRHTIDGGRGGRTLIQVAKNTGLTPVLRLNGTSDLEYEKYGILHDYPGLFKYDYTKGAKRVLDWLEGDLKIERDGKGQKTYFRSNGAGHFRGIYRYHLTLSLGGVLDKQADASRVYQKVLDMGGTVAAVWVDEATAMSKINGDGIDSFAITDQDGKVVKEIDLGRKRRVIDGNYMNGDIRFLDEPGVIVGLYAKGRTILKDAGRAFKTPCPKCGSLAIWSGIPGSRGTTCMTCTKRMRASGEIAPDKYFTFKPTIKGEMAHHGQQFFLNPSSRSGSRDKTGYVTDGLAMGAIRHEGKIIHIDCPG